MCSRTLFLAACFAAGLTACQPVPQPFSHTETGDSAALDLPDSGGIVVLKLADAPPATAAALAEAMAAALAERNIPAGTGNGNSRSYFLQGDVEDDGRDAAIVWTLHDPQGAIVDTVRQSIEGTPVEPWAQAEPGLMHRLARQVATQIAALVQISAPNENVLPAVFIAEVTGAPGTGNRQLANAVRRHLRALGLDVVEAGTENHVTVRGTVTVAPPSAGQQQATLDWRVVDSGQLEVGKIVQSNPVAAGSLDDSWGAIADIAARAAAEGIDALIRQVDWRTRDPAPAAPESGSAERANGRR